MCLDRPGTPRLEYLVLATNRSARKAGGTRCVPKPLGPCPAACKIPSPEKEKHRVCVVVEGVLFRGWFKGEPKGTPCHGAPPSKYKPTSTCSNCLFPCPHVFQKAVLAVHLGLFLLQAFARLTVRIVQLFAFCGVQHEVVPLLGDRNLELMGELVFPSSFSAMTTTRNWKPWLEAKGNHWRLCSYFLGNFSCKRLETNWKPTGNQRDTEASQARMAAAAAARREAPFPGKTRGLNGQGATCLSGPLSSAGTDRLEHRICS